MFHRRRIRSRRIREARKQQRVRVLVASVVLVLSVLFLLSQTSKLATFRIEQITVVGNKALSNRSLYEAVIDQFEGNYFFLFSRRNVALFPKSAMETTLLEQFPRLKTATIRATSLHDVEIGVVEREMVGIVCTEDIVDEVVSGVCHFIDETGFVYAPAPTFSGDSFFRYYDVDANSFQIGSYFLPADDFRQVIGLQEALVQLGVSPRGLTIGSQEETEPARHLTFELTEGTELIFSAETEELEEQLQNLQAILTSGAFVEESGGDIGTIEYIDMRFGNKVFYRLEEGLEG